MSGPLCDTLYRVVFVCCCFWWLKKVFSSSPKGRKRRRRSARGKKKKAGENFFCLFRERGVVLVIKLLAFVVLLPRRAKRKCVCVDQTFRFFFFVTLLFFSTPINPLSLSIESDLCFDRSPEKTKRHIRSRNLTQSSRKDFDETLFKRRGGPTHRHDRKRRRRSLFLPNN